MHPLHSIFFLIRSLYLGLTTIDFLSCWVLLVGYIINVLGEKDEECWRTKGLSPDICENRCVILSRNVNIKICDNRFKLLISRLTFEFVYFRYYLFVREATFWESASSLIGWSFFFAPPYFTCFLVMTRFYQIKCPFRKVHVKRIMGGVILLCFYGPTIILICTINSVTGYWFNCINLVWIHEAELFDIRMGNKFYVGLILTPSISLQSGSIIASILTIYELVKVRRNPISDGSMPTSHTRTRYRGTIKILIANFGSILSLMGSAVLVHQSNIEHHKITLREALFYAVFSTGLATVVSTFNPLIYVLCTKDFWRSLHSQYLPQRPAAKRESGDSRATSDNTRQNFRNRYRQIRSEKTSTHL